MMKLFLQSNQRLRMQTTEKPFQMRSELLQKDLLSIKQKTNLLCIRFYSESNQILSEKQYEGSINQ